MVVPVQFICVCVAPGRAPQPLAFGKSRIHAVESDSTVAALPGGRYSEIDKDEIETLSPESIVSVGAAGMLVAQSELFTISR